MRRLVLGSLVVVSELGLVLVLLFALDPGSARAEDPAAEAQSPSRFGACSAEAAERLGFLEQRLERDRRWASNWWKLWTTTYGLGTVVTSVQAGLEDDDGDRAVATVSAVKALFGTTRLLVAPPNAKDGADALRAQPAATESQCLAAVERGEIDLRQNAEEARSRYSWVRHAAVVGVNVAGALIAGEAFDDREDAWKSAALGIVVGEAMVWTHPRRAAQDLPEYERRFGVSSQPTVSWSLVPLPGGIAVHAAF